MRSFNPVAFAVLLAAQTLIAVGQHPVSSLGMSAAGRFLAPGSASPRTGRVRPVLGLVAVLGGCAQEDLGAAYRALLQRAVAER